MYYKIYDKVLSELNARFEEPKGILQALDACHPNSTEFLNETRLLYLASEYSIEITNLKAEIAIIKPLLNDIMSITDVLTKIKPMKQGFKSLWQLLQFAVTFPVANTKCERSFSVLKLLKTYIRSTMGQTRLTSLAILSVEKKLVNDLDLDTVVDKFAHMGAHAQRRLQLTL